MICRLCYKARSKERLCKECHALLLQMLRTSPDNEHIKRIYNFYVTSSSDT